MNLIYVFVELVTDLLYPQPTKRRNYSKMNARMVRCEGGGLEGEAGRKSSSQNVIAIAQMSDDVVVVGKDAKVFFYFLLLLLFSHLFVFTFQL